MPLSQIIKDGESWKRVEGEFGPIGGLSWDPNLPSKKLAVFDAKGKLFAEVNESLKVNRAAPGEMFDSHSELVRGKKYEIKNFKLYVDGQEVKIPLKEPTDIQAWKDGGTVVISDAADKYLWAFRVQLDGSLGPGDRYYSLYVRRGQTRSEASEMVVDNKRRLYVGSKEGVQVFDPTGRLCGTLTKPSNDPITALEFGGEKGDLLFMACGNQLFVRRMLAQASFIPPPEPKKKN
jgi:enterochelin esterase family protein